MGLQMKNPDPLYEKRMLLDVVDQMRDPELTLRKESRLRRVILGVGSVGLVVAFFLAFNDLTHPFVATFLAGAAGCLAGLGLFLEFAQKQWPITRKHIDMDSVRARLKALED